jgi:hypothetical protein
MSPASPKLVPPTKRVSSSLAYDNIIQKRYIHGRGRLQELWGKLDVRSAWFWIYDCQSSTTRPGTRKNSLVL